MRLPAYARNLGVVPKPPPCKLSSRADSRASPMAGAYWKNGEVQARRRQEVIRLAHAGLSLPTLLDETVRILGKTIPFEGGCWHILDPDTLLETSWGAVNLPAENPLAAEIEYLHKDYNQFATLARAPKHSGILSVATGGAPERSLRYRELIRPFGLDGELRAAFVSGGSAWGAICLLRDRSSEDFCEQEASFLEEISGHVGHGIRAAQLLQAASAGVDDAAGPGLILLDDRHRIEAMTSQAERLLRELTDAPNPADRELPYIIHAVAAKARVAGRSSGTEVPARAHVRTKSGQWLTLHGSLIAGEPHRRIAVILEPAKPPNFALTMANAYGLTRRESEVMRHMLQGSSTKEIATTLRLSPYTVQEHFSSIFDKVGVRSRRELAGKVFR